MFGKSERGGYIWKFVEPEVTFENSPQKIELELKDE